MFGRKDVDCGSFQKRLIIVPGMGLCYDEKTSQIICPRCEAKGHLSFMANYESDADGKLVRNLHCYACGKHIAFRGRGREHYNSSLLIAECSASGKGYWKKY